jgi:hypothetical protein
MLARWRKNKRRKRTMSMRVRDVVSVLQKIEELGARYVVLRWADEVPTTMEQENLFGAKNDIDILTDIRSEYLPGLAKVAVCNLGQVACDLYSISGGVMAYNGMPYYPPILGEEILQHRQKHKNGFYVPGDDIGFLSLAFHLVYHKGLNSGIPSGCELLSVPNPKRPYHQHIENFGRQSGVEIEQPYTLLKMHEYLKKRQWSMPYDLLERWPNKSTWHHYLLNLEIELLRPWAQRLPGLLVFFVRGDEKQMADITAEELSKKFQILHVETLSEEQINRVVRLVRGGNWLQRNKNLGLAMPRFAVLCYDHSPVAIDQSDEERNTSYPLVRNKNVFIKHQIRETLGRNVTCGDHNNRLHGSDNEYEAQHMLKAIYGDRTEEVNLSLEKSIKMGA